MFAVEAGFTKAIEIDEFLNKESGLTLIDGTTALMKAVKLERNNMI